MAEYRDDAREYLEIAVLQVTLRPGARADRIIELMHRAVPYPVFLIAWKEETPGISLAHKRWSLGEAGKTVVDGEIIAAELAGRFPHRAFKRILRLPTPIPSTSDNAIRTLPRLDRSVTGVESLRASLVIFGFQHRRPCRQQTARSALQEYLRLDGQIKDMRAAASKEKQLARLVEMNVKLKRLQAERNAARTKL